MKAPAASLLMSLALTWSSASAQSELEQIRGEVQAALESPGAVGLSIAVARGTTMIFEEGAGLAEVEHDVEANAQTMFRIGSVTKQFTAAAIVRFAEEGTLEIDEDFRAYLPDYPETEEVITVRHLLTHTSGIPSYTGLGPSWQATVAHELAHEELLSLFEHLALEFSPGTKWNYNNSGYYLLGMIIEAQSGQDYGTHLADTLFRPLGLTRTRNGSNEAIIKNRAQGYRLIQGVLHNDGLIGMSQPGAAGALLSTAGDLVRWQLALVGRKVVGAVSYEEMTTPFLLPSNRDTGYGFGLQLGESQGHQRVSHGGGIFGFNSILVYYPEAELSIAVISNSEDYDSSSLERRLAGILLGA